MIGTSRRSRVARLFDEGIGATVVRQSGPIDVHMVTHAEAGGRLRARLGASPLGFSRLVAGWVLSVVLPVLVTVIGLFVRTGFDFATDVISYVLATVVVALVGGLGPALVAAVLGAGLLNFFFTPPLYTLTVHTPQNLVTLIAMVVVAVLVALVVDAAARRATQAARARTEAALLASYARTVLTHANPIERLLEKVRENFALTSVTLLEKREGEWRGVATAGEHPCADPDEADVDIAVTADVHLTLRGARCPRRTGGCWRPWPGKRCFRCGSSAVPTPRRKPSARPRPPSCARRCFRPSGTTCGRR